MFACLALHKQAQSIAVTRYCAFVPICCVSLFLGRFIVEELLCQDAAEEKGRNLFSPWAKRFRGVIRPESSPHVFLLTKTLNLKKKSGGHLSVVAFGSERPLSENIYTF